MFGDSREFIVYNIVLYIRSSGSQATTQYIVILSPSPSSLQEVMEGTLISGLQSTQEWIANYDGALIQEHTRSHSDEFLENM